MSNKGQTYRLYPTKSQQESLAQMFGCTRWVFNHFFAERQEQYRQTGKSDFGYTDYNKLPKLKKEYPWLSCCPAQALQNSIGSLDRAYKNFWDRCKKGTNPRGFPNFKSKHGKQSLTVSQGLKALDNSFSIPKLGVVKAVIHRPIDGRLTGFTISKTKTGKYWISLRLADFEPQPLPKTGKSIGIDLGIKDFAILSDGEKVPNPKHLKRSEKKLAKAQRSLSRKQKGSSNRDKARLVVAKTHERIANQRNDFLHKTSKRLIEDYDVLCIEDLAVSNMVKNHKLAKSISDAGWAEFRRKLAYKAEWYGKELKIIDRWEPSSKTCSVCGSKQKQMPLSVREWVCPDCGSIHDRDINAARNILRAGTAPAACGEDVRQCA